VGRIDADTALDCMGGRDAGVGAPWSSSSSSSETISGLGAPNDTFRSSVFNTDGRLLRSFASGWSVSISLFVHVPSG
jgi:hypothetical protein